MGGAEKLMVDLLPRLRDKGNEVELLVFRRTASPLYQPLRLTGITVHHLSETSQNVYSPLHILRLRRFIGKYDIIHTHNTACQLFVPLAKVLALKSQTIVTTEHNTTNRRRGNPLFYLIDRWMYSRYRHIICISSQTEENLRTYMPSIHHISTIANGIDYKRFCRPLNDITGKSRFVITMVAAFREQKDQDTLVRAMTMLPECYTLQLVGDGVRRAKVEQYTASLGLQERVLFLGIRSDVSEILGSSDFAALISHYEGFGLSSVEGMASGRVFIASDVPGLREIVQGAGIIVPAQGAEEIAQAILSLSHSPEKYRQIANACQRRAADFDISKMADGYYNIYQSILTER